MPELEAKIKIPPNTNNITISGISHHFFSCRANSRNSLNKRHMLTCNLESALLGWQAQTRRASFAIAIADRLLNGFYLRSETKPS